MSEELNQSTTTVDTTGASAVGETTPAQPADTSPAQQNVKDTGNQQEKQDDTSKKAEEKTFTQSDLDAIIQERLRREREKQPKAEELEEFRNFQKSKKTAEQLASEELNEAKRISEESKAELAKYKQIDSIRKLNIEEGFIGYVHYEASELAKTQDIPFDEALMRFMKQNADKYAKQETRSITVDTGTKEKEQQKTQMAFQFSGVRPRK